MFRPFLLGIVLTVAGLTSPHQSRVLAQPPQEGTPSGPHDYKVAYWFERKNPIDTFQFKIYDVTKGEYSPAVDRWLTTMKTRFPGHAAYVREYHGTGKELADKVIGELLVIAGPNLGFGIRDTRGLGGPHELLKPLGEPVRGLTPIDSSLKVHQPSATYLNPVSPPSPFPFPYTRPHP
jgi:hypothetical protein